LLDEPTNHLDIESIQWLENFLSTRANAVVLVSHDRAFLNNVTTRTIEITCGRIYDYKVKYDEFVVLRKERREQQLVLMKTSRNRYRIRKILSSVSVIRPLKLCKCRAASNSSKR
jgi:ATPase subunit of ABC transporter with duplicated ATPase domains